MTKRSPCIGWDTGETENLESRGSVVRGELRAGQSQTREGFQGLVKYLILLLRIISVFKGSKIRFISDVIKYTLWKDNLTAV